MLTGVLDTPIPLLVSLNNRIYFRDHPGSGFLVDSDQLVEIDHSRRSAITSLHPTPVGSQARAATSGDGYKRNTISHTIDLEQGNEGDVVSFSSDAR
jgi:hypothetical protein